MPDKPLPLSGVRVVDFTDGVAGYAGRFLADLGADVVLVEPPEGAASRRAQPQYAGHSLPFATAHANKRGAVVDVGTAEGRQKLLRLIVRSGTCLESASVNR
jgi:crotonobetainyl-CoA:carnitine CoA-transferase CaiB-like acyl-CoA transferase